MFINETRKKTAQNKDIVNQLYPSLCKHKKRRSSAFKSTKTQIRDIQPINILQILKFTNQRTEKKFLIEIMIRQ